jgi:hypothetical protein
VSTRTIRGLASVACRLRREERGAVIVLLAVLGVGLAALGSFVVDYGRIMNAQKELQTAADAAALAAAQDLPDGTAAANTAYAYSAAPTATKGNTRPDLPDVITTANPKCLAFLESLGLVCYAPNPYNAIKVDQDADVPLLFLGGLGIPGIHVHASAMAAMKGGAAYPLDVMIVLDRTGSMSQSVGSGQTRISQARAGIQSFLGAMRPSSDKIGLDLFPPTNATSCNYSEPSSPYENAQNGYVVVQPRNDFRTSDTGPLNTSSPLVQAVSGSCPSVGGITAYTTAIQKAKDELNANGRSNAQDVIIFFTDGEANYGPCASTSSCSATAERQAPCGSANTLATNLKAGAPPAGEPPAFIGGTWIYTILYSTSSSSRCKGWKATGTGGDSESCAVNQANQAFPCDEEPAPVTAHNTLQSMASVGSDGLSRFYTSQDDLTQIFKRIAIDLSSTRLLPDDTQ